MRRSTAVWLAVDVVLIVLFFWIATACNPFFFLPPFHEGPHRTQPTTAADTLRVHDVVACLGAWATRDYSDVSASRLVIVRVGGDGVVGSRDGATWQTDARENGDTIFVNEGVSESEYVGLLRHEAVHVAQSQHRELVGSDGNIHWPPPFTACRVPLAVFR